MTGDELLQRPALHTGSKRPHLGNVDLHCRELTPTPFCPPQDCLGSSSSSSVTTLVACVSLAAECIEDTRATLECAQLVCNARVSKPHFAFATKQPAH